MKAYKFKLKINKKFESRCEQTLDICRELYNAGLWERRDAYKLNGIFINFHNQAIQLPALKKIRKDARDVHSQVLQDTLRRLSRAFDNFFRRVKAGEKPGYPRFKAKRFFNSFTYPQSGFGLEGDKLHLSKIGSCRIRLSREIEGRIKTCTIKKQVDGWFVVFTVEETYSPFIAKTGQSIGIDVGIENFATFSNGRRRENPQYLAAAEQEIKIAQRKVSKKKHGGSNRKKAARILARKHQRVANQRRDFFHKTANEIIEEFDEISVEDLNIKGMVKNHHLAKSISDAGWNTFLEILISKAANAGRRVWKVAAAFTSQDCSECGERVRKTLAEREHVCIGCGLVLNRDHNAAINIAARGRAQSVAYSGASLMRDPLARVGQPA
jgi:putative transposase